MEITGWKQWGVNILIMGNWEQNVAALLANEKTSCKSGKR
jgi:hypothetical protein